jgi:hypothetical protein
MVNSTTSKTGLVQNNTDFIPVQNASNIVIANPGQEVEQEQQPSLSLSPSQQQLGSNGIQIPLDPSLPDQQPQISSLPIYPQEPSIIQSELLFPSLPTALAYPEAPSFIQLLQNLPSLTSAYPEAPSLIQSQQLFQSIPLEPILQPLYSYPVNTLATLPVLLPETIQPIQIPPRVLSHSSYVNNIGSLHIVGEVINESYQTVRFVKITATFYDVNNAVIGTDFAYTSPSTLQPGQRAPFDIIVFEGSIPTHLLAYYALSVDYSDI